ncbi:hypothetical protein ACE1MS_11810 [Lysinibacillus sp. fkY74-1]
MADTNQFTLTLKNNKKAVVSNVDYATGGSGGFLNFDLDNRQATFSINTSEVLFLQKDNYEPPKAPEGNNTELNDYIVTFKTGKTVTLKNVYDTGFIGELVTFTAFGRSVFYAVNAKDLLSYDILNQGETKSETFVKIIDPTENK